MRAFRPAPQELYHEYLYFVGWASCPSLMISGQDARTTRNFWVFF